MFCNNLAAVSRRLSRREGKLFPNQKKETFLVGTRAARKKHEHKLISFFLSFVTEKKKSHFHHRDEDRKVLATPNEQRHFKTRRELFFPLDKR